MHLSPGSRNLAATHESTAHIAGTLSPRGGVAVADVQAFIVPPEHLPSQAVLAAVHGDLRSMLRGWVPKRTQRAIVYDALSSTEWLTVRQLSGCTGLPCNRVQGALSRLDREGAPVSRCGSGKAHAPHKWRRTC